MKIKLSIIVLLAIALNSFGQIKQYNYKSKIKGIDSQWHQLILPNHIFGEVSNDLNDLRIFGITSENDTIEAPFILDKKEEKNAIEKVDFKIINQSKKGNDYYFTFELTVEKDINKIILDFEQVNFDWRAALEGSQNQQEWFSILEDYRLVSIKNGRTSFNFSTLNFPNSKYRYFRVKINADQQPTLRSSKIISQKTTPGNYRNFAIKKMESKEDKKNKTTIIELDLKQPLPVSYLEIKVQNEIDFYRPMEVKYLAESLETEQGWKYNYRTLTSGTLNSIEPNILKFPGQIAKQLRLIIQNKDNEPLQIDQVIVQGIEHHMIARFTKEADYFLVFGNKNARKSNYDIARFRENIPANLTSLTLDKMQRIEKIAQQKKEPLFKNKLWLYGIMGLIILLLGWFSLKMIKSGTD